MVDALRDWVSEYEPGTYVFRTGIEHKSDSESVLSLFIGRHEIRIGVSEKGLTVSHAPKAPYQTEELFGRVLDDLDHDFERHLGEILLREARSGDLETTLRTERGRA